MSKLIDADKLKASVAEKYVRQRKTKKEWWEESLSIMEIIDSQPDVVITCCKCHGKGVYGVPKFDDETYMPSMTEWEDRPCEVCHGTGKISLQFYEELQRGRRR